MLADWDARLLSPERALRLAGDWPLYATFEISLLSDYGDQPDQWQINLRCRKCQQSCGLLANGSGTSSTVITAAETSIGDLLSGVLRHLVTAHDLSLSGGSDG